MRTWSATLVPTLALLLAACGPVSATVIGDNVSDTDVDSDSDTDVDTDSDTDTDTDPDTDPPVPAYGEWIGSRFIDFGRCEGVLEEQGVLTDEPEANQACPECDAVYRVEVGPRQVCGVGVRSPVYRGVILGRGAVIVNILPDDRGEWVAEELGQGSYERSPEVIVIGYDYDGEIGPTEFEVEGNVELLRTE